MIARLFGSKWQYGTVLASDKSATLARRSRKTGLVEIQLWPAGHYRTAGSRHGFWTELINLNSKSMFEAFPE